jgi:cytochrome o ubiquinol oxidase operon protein cyoD
MSEHKTPVVSRHEPVSGSLRTYTIGFLLSIILTLIAFGAVELHIHGHLLSSRDVIIGGIIGLALIQFLVQLFFFLHLGRETRPRWKLVVFGFMIMVICILVMGSLWIMSSLNYRMTPQQVTQYLKSQDGL